jgi:putative sterol carrier protein
MPKCASAAECLRELVASTDPQTLTGTDAVILFDITGDGGGQWTLTLTDGYPTLADGAGDSPELTLRIAADDFTALVGGTMNPIGAFMQGRIKVEGDVGMALRLQALFAR